MRSPNSPNNTYYITQQKLLFVVNLEAYIPLFTYDFGTQLFNIKLNVVGLVDLCIILIIVNSEAKQP